MMSPVAPDAGGRVVISQVRPPNAEGQSYNAPANIPEPLVRFYRGEPEVLGTTQIFAGILLLSSGVVMIIVENTIHRHIFMNLIGVPIWSGILFITSGSLSVSASRKPTVGKVTASLVMNIFSSLAAVSGVITYGVDVATYSFRPPLYMSTFCAHYNNDSQCLGAFTPQPVLPSLSLYVLLLWLLMFCISISTSVFACRTVCHMSFEETTVVIYQTVNVSATTREDPPDYSPAGTSD